MGDDGLIRDDDPQHRSVEDPFATRSTAAGTPAPADPLGLPPGRRIDDFEIVKTLGRGSFGAVYLARQLSLDRRVALKVSTCRGQEGKALARLDHPHIVSVYSQQAVAGLRLLCMQYVPSLALDELLRLLAPRGRSWTGADLLAAIDAAQPEAADFDPAQLEDRQLIAGLDHVAAVCFIGSRLAAALAHAHRQGVLHRDIKAGNVLVSHYGRPLLVDFNMAAATAADEEGETMFGGTLPYMAPEHLAAFDPTDRTTAAAVGEASDQYALGVLVYELATGHLPFAPADATTPLADQLRHATAIRHRTEPLWQDAPWCDEPGLAAVLRRALAFAPRDRWPSCAVFADALRDTIDLRRTLEHVRHDSPLPRWCLRHPRATLLAAGVLPNVVGSAVNTPYTLVRIVPERHEAAFLRAVNTYNAVVFPLCVVIFWAVAWPVFRGLSGTSGESPDRLRRRAVGLPGWATRMAVLGWLPAAVFFPWALHSVAGTIPWTDVAHFHIAIALAGLIALTYSTLLVLCVVAFIFYPAFWTDPTDFRARAAAEVRPLLVRLRFLPFFAGAIPLLGATLLVTASPHTFSPGEYEAFRLLTTTLIALGMAGFHLARQAMTRARAALEAFLHVPPARSAA